MNAFFAELMAADRMADIERELELARLVAAARQPSSRTSPRRLTRLVIAIACLAVVAYQWMGLAT